MENSNVLINVLIITYKQELLIKRAIESVLCQKQYGLNKIIICDDCSPDNTWETIQSYKIQYPNLIEAYKNDKNLGIYGNFERVVSLRGDAELYHIMVGDDALCNGWFKSIQEFLKGKKEVLDKAAFILSDWKQVTPKGEEYVYSQSIIENKALSLESLKIRGLISIRSMMQTKKLISLQTPVDLTGGISKAEKFFDFQPFTHAEQSYYCPFVGSIYYSGIGVSTKASDINYRREKIVANRSFLQEFDLTKKDSLYVRYRIVTDEYYIHPSFRNYIAKIWYYIKSVDLKLGFSVVDFCRVVLNKK